MSIDLQQDIAPYSAVTMVIPNEVYVKSISDIAKLLTTTYHKICYVSLNKLYMPLIRGMKVKQIDVTKFFFIDAITKTAVAEPGNIPNCFFVSAPDNLTELGIAIQKTITGQQCDILLFDSLSTLLIYKNVQVVTQFVHSIVGQIGAANCIAVFTCLEGKKETDLIKDLSMFVDNTVHIPAAQSAPPAQPAPTPAQPQTQAPPGQPAPTPAQPQTQAPPAQPAPPPAQPQAPTNQPN